MAREQLTGFKAASYVLATIENEGFEGAFVDYTDFENVTDEKFHELRLTYLAARKALAEYLGVDA